MKTVLSVLGFAALVWGAARAQVAVRTEQYSVTVSLPEFLVPNCPDTLYAATSAFVQLEYQQDKSSTPLGFRLEPAVLRVVYNAQYALGFALDLELSVIARTNGVQLKRAFSSSTVPGDVTTRALREYADRVFTRQLEWIAATVQADPCRFHHTSTPSANAAANVNTGPAHQRTTALMLKGRIQFSQEIESLSSDQCDRSYSALPRPALLSNLQPLSAGCVLIRRLNAAAFNLELSAQMRGAGFTLLSSATTPLSSVTEAYSQLWQSNEALVWLRYASGTNTTMLWQRFNTR